MQRIQQAERQGDVIGDLDGRERFASAGFCLSETSSDVPHLPERVLGEAEEESGWAGEGEGASLLVWPATGRDKG